MFREFRFEVRGRHDGRRVEVPIDQANEPIVASHETIHDQILTQTPDGQSLYTLIRAQGETDSAGNTETLETTVSCLISECEFAHEVAATYLSLKLRTPDQALADLASFPDAYRKYYLTLATILDDNFKSTYLQYLVGWGISVFTFSSPYLLKLGENDWSGLQPSLPNESPNQRLKTVLGLLDPTALSSLSQLIERAAHEKCRQLQLKMWDLNSDLEWEEKAAHAEPIEEAISHSIWDWLTIHANLPVLNENSHARALSALSNRLSPYSIKLNERLHWTNGISPRTVCSAHSLANSVILTVPGHRLSRCDPHIFETDELVRRFDAFSLTSADIPDHLTDCHFLAWNGRNESPTAGTTVSVEQALKWLSYRMEKEDVGERVPQALAITFRIQSVQELAQVAAQTFKAVLSADACGNLRGSAGEVLCWYWSANWIDLIEMHLRDCRPQITTLTPVDNPRLRANEGAGVAVKILKVPNAPGYFVRAFNHIAAARIIKLEMELERKGLISPLQLNTPMVRDMVSHCVSAARRFWTNF
jgi:hypothetical protein